MRIERIRLAPYACPLPTPWPSAEGPVAVREGVILTIEEEGGRVGLGESAPFPGFGLETIASSVAALRLAAKYLIGMPRDRYPGAVADLHRLAPVMATPSARHAIDLALHDLLSQDRQVPMARLLGGDRALDEVPINAALPRLPRRELALAAATAVAEGYRTLKIKVGGASTAEDVDRVRAVRDQVGADVRLRLDANRSWNEAQAVEALQALDDAGLEYCEEPVAGVDSMARVKAAAPVRLAADESVIDLDSARRILDEDAADVLVLKPMALGGLHPAGAIASLARERGVEVVVTTMLESPVGRRGALHLAASLGPARHAHGLAVGCTPWPAPLARPHTRHGSGRVLRLGDEEDPGTGFRIWQGTQSDFEEDLLEEEEEEA
jgi:o-succinylbenzoate synthase